MARSRNLSFPRGSGANRRLVSWALGPRGTVGTISGSSNNTFQTGAQALDDGLTIVRIRGRLLINLLSASAASEGFGWAFGMGIVSENAAGIGVTALPDPIADIAWDGWMVYETGFLMARDATPLTSDLTALQIVIDSKAMRKIKNTDVLVAMFGTLEIGTATIAPFLESRLLAKLS